MIRIPDLIDIVLYFFSIYGVSASSGGFSWSVFFFFFIKEMIIFDNIDPSLFSV